LPTLNPPSATGGSAPPRPPSPTLDPEARRALLEAHLPMVRRLAARMARAFPASVELDDLASMGTLGLLDAVDRFQPDRSLSFTAFARIRARGAIVDAMRADDWVPRAVRDRGARLREAEACLHRRLGRAPTRPELAAHLEVSAARLRELEAGSVVRDLVSFDRPREEDGSLDELLPDDACTPAESADAADLRRLVRGALGILPDRDRMILELYYFRDKEFKEIAAVLGVTESRLSQLHKRILQDLRQKPAIRACAA